MKLTDLDPRFAIAHGEDPDVKTGINLSCPCGCDNPLFIPFSNPIGGGQENPKGWRRTGETFADLTLTPSIHRIMGCPRKWHGFITNGEIQTV